MVIKDVIRRNAEKIVKDCCNIQPGEQVVIVTDTEQAPELAPALYAAVLKYQAQPTIITMEKCIPGTALPSTVCAALLAADVIITPTSTSIYHTEGIRLACSGEHPARLLAISECSEDLMSKGGIETDFVALKPIVEKVGERYQQGSRIVCSTPAGTHIEADIGGRPACMNLGLSHAPGEKNGIPTIEVFIAPIENSVNGTIVVDASCSGGVGKIVDAPIRLTVVDGKAVDIAGGTEAKKLRELLANAQSDAVYQVAELAIGLNPKCRITGNITEDEGKYGTCHMALGSNTGFGGINSAPLHIDMVQYDPTILIDGQLVCVNGVLAVADMSAFL